MQEVDMAVEDDDDDLLEAFRKQLSETTPFIQVVLNGHFDVERQLDEFVDQIFLYPKHLENARLGFFQKVHIARAYAPPESDDRPEWRLMLELNSLRNKIAHRNTRKSTFFDVSGLLRIMNEIGSEESKEKRKGIAAEDAVVHAAAICSGYLIYLKEGLMRAQGFEVEEDD
jgi:hypothetical protein